MVQDTVLVGIVGIGGTLLGSVATGIFSWITTKQRIEAERENLEIKQQSETERRRGEYYLEKKVEALMEVYAVLEETRREYKVKADKAGHGGISEEEYEEVIEWYHEYERAMDRAAVFLTEEQHDTLLQVFDFIHKLNSFLHGSIDFPETTDYSEFELGEYNDRFDAAEATLKDEINGPIQAISGDQRSK